MPNYIPPSKDKDSVQRFVFEDVDIRGEIVHLNASLANILQQHAYPPVIEQYLAQALLAAVLLTAIIKFKGELTLQFSGLEQGPLKLLVAKCDHQCHIRGLAQFADDIDEQTLVTAFANGNLVVTIIPDNNGKAYQSIIPINQHSIAKCLEAYFAQSEQISTHISLHYAEGNAAGILLQLLPAAEKKLRTSELREQFWRHASTLAQTLTTAEVLSLDNATILHRLYHQENIRLFESAAVIFRCSCSQAAMENAVSLLGREEAEAIIHTEATIVVACEYCGSSFPFDRVDVERILRAAGK